MKHPAPALAGRPIFFLPQLSSCGPIEAGPSGWLSLGSFTLPQLSSCGPIEARAWRRPRPRSRPFRNYQVAAPLKPVGLHAAAEARRLPQLSSCGPIEATFTDAKAANGVLSLPQLSSCGPIEARGRLLRRTSRSAFRNYQVAAPLKRHRGRWARSAICPSATIKLRPH